MKKLRGFAAILLSVLLIVSAFSVPAAAAETVKDGMRGHFSTEITLNDPYEPITTVICSNCHSGVDFYAFTPYLAAACTIEEMPNGEDYGYWYENCWNCGTLNKLFNMEDPVGHKWYQSDFAYATCTTEGWYEITCSFCGETEHHVTGPAYGHKWEVLDILSPTCLSSGYNVYICSECHETKSERTADPTDHIWGDADSWTVTLFPRCETEGKAIATCKSCGATDEKTIPALGHNWGPPSTITATCTQPGGIYNYCPSCGKETFTQTEPVAPHTFVNETVVTAPTCLSGGWNQHTCSVCGYVEGYPTPAGAHNWVQTPVAADCLKAGGIYSECSVCHASSFTETEPAKGHSFGEWKANGAEEEIRTCSVCGASETRAAEKAADPDDGKTEAGAETEGETGNETGSETGNETGNETEPSGSEGTSSQTPATQDERSIGIAALQALLIRDELFDGPIDGFFGKETLDALHELQEEAELPEEDELTDETLLYLASELGKEENTEYLLDILGVRKINLTDRTEVLLSMEEDAEVMSVLKAGKRFFALPASDEDYLMICYKDQFCYIAADMTDFEEVEEIALLPTDRVILEDEDGNAYPWFCDGNDLTAEVLEKEDGRAYIRTAFGEGYVDELLLQKPEYHIITLETEDEEETILTDANGRLPYLPVPEAEDEDFEFVCWADEEDQEVTENTVFTEDAVLTAVFEEISEEEEDAEEDEAEPAEEDTEEAAEDPALAVTLPAEILTWGWAYDGPTVRSGLAFEYDEGDEVEILAMTAGFCLAELDGERGYIRTEDLECWLDGNGIVVLCPFCGNVPDQIFELRNDGTSGLLPEAEKKDAEFTGWFTDPYPEAEKAGQSTVFDYGVYVLYAGYEPAPEQYVSAEELTVYDEELQETGTIEAGEIFEVILEKEIEKEAEEDTDAEPETVNVMLVRTAEITGYIIPGEFQEVLTEDPAEY